MNDKNLCAPPVYPAEIHKDIIDEYFVPRRTDKDEFMNSVLTGWPEIANDILRIIKEMEK